MLSGPGTGRWHLLRSENFCIQYMMATETSPKMASTGCSETKKQMKMKLVMR